MDLGLFNVLKIERDTDHGLYLIDEEGTEVLLPNKYVPEEWEVGQEISAFIYKDSEDRLVATNLEPYIQTNYFAYLQVKAVGQFGAFLDWGLEKDLLVPFKEQANRMVEDAWYVVYMYVDEESDRLVATSKTRKYLNKIDMDLAVGDEVDVLVCGFSDLGMNVIVNDAYSGLIYENEIYEKVLPGDYRKAYVKMIREDDKLDVSLQPIGVAVIEPNAQKILQTLKDQNGFVALTDKSSPDVITTRLGMSKKTFKKALGSLYKQRVVRIEKDGIYLIEDGEPK